MTHDRFGGWRDGNSQPVFRRYSERVCWALRGGYGSENAEDNPKTQVVIDVEPSNTSIYFDPISEVDGYPDDRRREELIGSRPQWMPPGFYRVTLEHGEEQLQVYRTIPRRGDQAIGESTGVPLAIVAGANATE